MNYNDLVILAKQKNLSVSEFAKQIGMTRQGLQTATTNKTMAMDKIINLCRILGITPNEFFEWENETGTVGAYAANISSANMQNSNEAIKALNDQLKEKDRQISRLMTMLEKRDGLSSEDGTVYPYIAAEGNNKGRGKK